MLPKMLRVGLNGYYLKQFTDTKVNGHNLSGRREQVLGLGPGGIFHFSQNSHLFFNAYFETEARNRAEGYRLNLRFVQHFLSKTHRIAGGWFIKSLTFDIAPR